MPTVLQGIWVSRPASFNPLISFLNEFIMTFIFLFLVNLMTARCGSSSRQPAATAASQHD